MPPDREIALLTESRYESPRDVDWYVQNILEEDRLVAQALAAHGLQATRVDWARPDFDWSRFRAAVLRTTWDYWERLDEFSRWLGHAAGQTDVFNAPAIVRWSIDKHYLADLDARRVSVVPTRYVERGATAVLADILDEMGWDEAVLKPCVSGAARETYRISRSEAREHQATLERLLAVESMMLQPFLTDVLERGEVTLVAFDGEVTHAVRKVGKPGDFRVQDDYGGRVMVHEATPDERALAIAALRACPELPLYGRVDMVRDADGQPCVMELELVEPELWFRCHPPAADVFAGALARRLAAKPEGMP